MTDKQIEEKREEFITTFPSLYEGLGTGSYLEIHDKVWQWIEELIKEVERESKKGLICQDGEVHRFKMTYESPSVENYYQVQEYQKCGFRKLTNLLNVRDD